MLAVVVANLAVARWGQVALVFTAWVLIPLDMLARDFLHDRWRGKRLVLRMVGLVAVGGVFAAALNMAAWRVAVASVCAFVLAMTVNALVFEVAARRGVRRFGRMTVSNLFASVMDSVVFPVVAFGTFDAWLSVAQAGSKFCGGLVWSAVAIAVIEKRKRKDKRDDLEKH